LPLYYLDFLFSVMIFRFQKEIKERFYVGLP